VFRTSLCWSQEGKWKAATQSTINRANQALQSRKSKALRHQKMEDQFKQKPSTYLAMEMFYKKEKTQRSGLYRHNNNDGRKGSQRGRRR